jgi:hypothetical protein
MNINQQRKAQTGEPTTNGGHFGSAPARNEAPEGLLADRGSHIVGTPLVANVLQALAPAPGFVLVEENYTVGRAADDTPINPFTILRLAEAGLITIADKGRNYTPTAELTDAGRELAVKAQPPVASALAPQRLEALATIATNTVDYSIHTSNEGKTIRTVWQLDEHAPKVRVPDAAALLKNGYVEVAESDRLTLTDKGTQELDQQPLALATAEAEVRVRAEHKVRLQSYRRGNSTVAGGGSNFRGTSASCSCGWTTRSNQGQKDAEERVRSHLEMETLRAVDAADAQAAHA